MMSLVRELCTENASKSRNEREKANRQGRNVGNFQIVKYDSTLTEVGQVLTKDPSSSFDLFGKIESVEIF